MSGIAQQPPDVSIVIANWNTRQLLRDCLASVYDDLADGPLSGEVIVVDNGSTDGSATMVAAEFPQVRLLRNQENRGYAQAANQGIVEAWGRHIMLLNSDTVVTRGTMGPMVECLDLHPRLGGVAPRLLNPNGTIQRSCWPFPMKALLANTFSLYRLGMLDDYRSWDHAYDRQVDWVTSTALMIPRRVFDEVGLLDERLFYFVDPEWAHRAARAGYRFMSLSRGAVVHYGKGSQQGEGIPRLAGDQAVHALYFRKHYGVLGVCFYWFVLIGGSLPRLLLWEVAHLFRLSRGADRRRLMFRQVLSSTLRGILKMESSDVALSDTITDDSVRAAEPRGAELVRRYLAALGIPADAGITEDMILKEWELEKRLRKELLASTPENRWEVFEQCYTTLYAELEWLNRLCHIEAKAPLAEVHADWRHLIGDPPKKIYEVGSGKGGLIRYLAEHGFECTGTEITRERGERFASHPNLSWGLTDGVHLDRFEHAASYDVVISDQVLEHLHPDDLLDHFRGALAILRPEGRYVFATPHAIHGPLDLSQVFQCEALMGLHLKEYTYGEIVRALKRAGFARAYAVLRLPWRIRRLFGGRPWPMLSRSYLIYLRVLERMMAPLSFPLRQRVARAAKAMFFYGVVGVAEKGR